MFQYQSSGAGSCYTLPVSVPWENVVGKFLKIRLRGLRIAVSLRQDLAHTVRALRCIASLLCQCPVHLTDAGRVECGSVHFDVIIAEDQIERLQTSLD